MLRLKAIDPDQEYPAHACAASRCEEAAVIVDATRMLSDRQVPLCERHWQARCELEQDEPEPEEMVIEIVERSGPPAAPAQRVARRRRRVDERQLSLPLV